MASKVAPFLAAANPVLPLKSKPSKKSRRRGNYSDSDDSDDYDSDDEYENSRDVPQGVFAISWLKVGTPRFVPF